GGVMVDAVDPGEDFIPLAAEPNQRINLDLLATGVVHADFGGFTARGDEVEVTPADTHLVDGDHLIVGWAFCGHAQVNHTAQKKPTLYVYGVWAMSSSAICKAASRASSSSTPSCFAPMEPMCRAMNARRVRSRAATGSSAPASRSASRLNRVRSSVAAATSRSAAWPSCRNRAS